MAEKDNSSKKALPVKQQGKILIITGMSGAGNHGLRGYGLFLR